MTTRILDLRSLRPTVTWRLVVMVLAFAFLAIRPIIHPYELVVLIPLAFVVSPRFRWLVPTSVVAFGFAVGLMARLS